MKDLKNNLKAVTKELKALSKKTEKILKAVAKLEKPSAVKKRKATAKKTKRAPAKKAVRKKAPAVTATDRILDIVKRSKKGVDVPTLIKKTEFEDKKVRNIVFRAFKQGKIKRTGKGIYAAV
jgi:septal ring factor EnvC (AmiA/AmiB activator)